MTFVSERFTKQTSGSFKEVTYLSLSFILVLFSASLMGLCDRLILARYSIEGLEAALTAFWLSQLFQAPILRAVFMTQAFVGQYKGAGQLQWIGPCIWQAIWFSFLTMLITFPLSEPIGAWFFQGTTLQEGMGCFRYWMAANFLFPLGAAISAFYLGQGQMRRIVIVNLVCHALHIILDFPLVFGIEGVLLPLGVKGSVIAAITAQSFFCCYLLFDFLRLKYQVYGTRNFFFQWEIFWEFLRVSWPRTAARLVHLAAWTCITRLVVAKGEDYVAVLTFGGSLQLFFSCWNEGISQALMTMGSYLIGAGKFFMGKLIWSASRFLGLGALTLAIPLLVFPENVTALFFKQPPTPLLQQILNLTCTWIWLFFVGEGLNYIGYGLLSAYGDTSFQMQVSFLAWVFAVAPVYFFIHLANVSSHSLWLILGLGCFVQAGIYFARLLQRKWEKLPSLFADQSFLAKKDVLE